MLWRGANPPWPRVFRLRVGARHPLYRVHYHHHDHCRHHPLYRVHYHDRCRDHPLYRVHRHHLRFWM